MGVQVWIVAVIAAVIGYVIGNSRSRGSLAPRQRELDIRVEKDGKYKSKTHPETQGVCVSDSIKWKINDLGHELPNGSKVFLRFRGVSPLFPEEPSEGVGRKIEALVVRGRRREKYRYKVFYRLDGVEHELEDPVLIIEG